MITTTHSYKHWTDEGGHVSTDTTRVILGIYAF